MWACIPNFQYAPFGKYPKKEHAVSDVRFTCGLEAALFVVSGKWKPLILFHLSGGARRYGELRRMVGGVSDKVLIQQLKELQADGAVSRNDYGEIPPRVEYSLTGFGESIVTALSPLCEWGGRHLDEIEAIASGRQSMRETAAPF